MIGARHTDDPAIRALVNAQIQPWRAYGINPGEMEAWVGHASLALHNVFRIDIDEDQVCKSKSGAFTGEAERRAELFRNLIEQAVRDRPLPGRLSFALDVGDLAPPRDPFPIFSFQKKVGDSILLLPDFELITLDFLRAVPLPNLPFEQRRTAAYFAGSTTGAPLVTMDAVRSGTHPRVRAAERFRSADEVDFLLPAIVQCADAEVEEYLRSRGFGGERVEIRQGSDYKFQISIDGNGAPCSRPALAMRNGACLLKYDSEYALYYSPSLQPWLHYVPVHADEDVIHFVRDEAAHPGRYAYVGKAAAAWSSEMLSRDAIVDYTRCLLASFMRLGPGRAATGE